MQVSVMTLTGAAACFLMSRSRSTVRDLKASIADEWQIPIPGQMLVHSGCLLSELDTSDLVDLGVKSGDTIIIFFSHRRHRKTYEQQIKHKQNQECSSNESNRATSESAVVQSNEWDPEKAKLLHEMGFRSTELVRRALVVNRNNIGHAVHWLSEHSTMPSDHVTDLR
uniref:UBA domain-containing protein n=1 Tax=Spongospora subterranea TaxID=70186 RepID=A0A0H5R0L6_9EUKA|eukprot:CRZ01294.1 hypothetical protein [Spongospora subterranea]